MINQAHTEMIRDAIVAGADGGAIHPVHDAVLATLNYVLSDGHDEANQAFWADVEAAYECVEEGKVFAARRALDVAGQLQDALRSNERGVS